MSEPHPHRTGQAAVSRRTVLTAGAAAGVTAGVAMLAGSGTARAAASGAGTAGPDAELPAVVLVHGAWSDGSAWAGVIEDLQRHGLTAVAVQLPLRSVAEDAGVVTRQLDDLGRPAVLVGHSYGGAVITVAGSHPLVRSLVFVAAFAPDQGESIGSLVGRFPPPPALAHITADAAGETTIDPASFPTVFAPDVPRAQARVLAATQGPLAGAAFGETVTITPAWRQRPSYYQVSAGDTVINPDLERFMARRMTADTITLDASHVSLVSRPAAVAALVRRAVQS